MPSVIADPPTSRGSLAIERLSGDAIQEHAANFFLLRGPADDESFWYSLRSRLVLYSGEVRELFWKNGFVASAAAA